MKITLIGYGKMGKAIEEIAIARGHEIVNKVTSTQPIESVDFSNTDVAIEFTRPELAVKHIDICTSKNIPIVVGTTSWLERLDEVKDIITHRSGSLLHASNFSVGVNIFFELNKKLAALMSNQPSYQVAVEEIHHVQKLDAPSGTAVTMLNDIIKYHDSSKNWNLSNNDSISEEGSIPVIAKREPDVPGTHEVRYVSEIDTISLKHVADNRKGFALGAVLAAEFIINKKGIFTMSDVLKF